MSIGAPIFGVILPSNVKPELRIRAIGQATQQMTPAQGLNTFVVDIMLISDQADFSITNGPSIWISAPKSAYPWS